MSKAKTALWYRQRLGWSVIPLHSIRDGACTCGRPECHSPAKHPVKAALPGGSWSPYQTTPPTPEQVGDWWRRWPQANLGLVTGASSKVVVVDVDPRHGGVESLANLQVEHGILPATVEANTGGGGCHLFFRHPGRPMRNVVNLVPGIDIRGDGGLIVLAPSDHASGGRYAWGTETRPDKVEVAEAPAWLLAMLDKPTRAAGEIANNTEESWVRVLLAGAPEGERNTTATKLAGYLLRQSLPFKVVIGLVANWNLRNQPPLPEDEIIRVVQSVAGREVHRRRAVNGA